MRRLFDRLPAGDGAQPRRDRAVIVGLVVTAVWLLLVVMFWLFAPAGSVPGGTARLLTAVGVVMPVALTWLAVSLARAIAALRAEADDLRGQLDRMRAGGADVAGDPRPAAMPHARPHTMPHPAPGPGSATGPAASRPAPMAAQPAPRDTARPATPRAPAPAPRATDSRQRSLPLDGDDSVPVSDIDLVLALNFPDGPDDHDAIRALRAALADHDTMRLIRSAQDVVTLLASAGVYMDDLSPRPAPPRLWRDFAQGRRGPQMAALAGLDDGPALETAATLLHGDEIFRDAAHHFLRQYDRTLARLAADGGDDLLAALAETRSGRAFMLLAQASGMIADTP